MRISLLTIWHVDNYGAELQTYATVRKLTELGYEVEVIDLRLTDAKVKIWKDYIRAIIQSFSPIRFKFNCFWRKHINKTRRYRNTELLCKKPPLADIYIIGSDQVWNPEITKSYALTYFGDFLKPSDVIISYASSFGTEKWNASEALTDSVKNLLATFKNISVREKSGVRILDETFQMKASWVVDPTLLYDNYNELIGIPIERKSVAYYSLLPFSELEDFAKGLAQQMGYQYINTNTQTSIMGRIVWNRPSIEEWVRNIAESSIVVTESFHGLAFSLIYKRQFIVFVKNESLKRSTRIISLLEELGLMDRFYTSMDDLKKSKIWELKIDYDRVTEKINDLREQSIHYLISALSIK